MRVGPAVQIARDVLQRLAIADGADAQDGIAAELLDGQLEGEAGAQGRLFEQQRDVSAGQSRGETAGIRLQLLSEIQQRK